MSNISDKDSSKGFGDYVGLKSGGWVRYLLEECFNSGLNWIPGPVGLFLRWVAFRLLISGNGFFAIERGVEIFGTQWLTIGRGVYLGERAMLYGRPGGLKIGDGVRIMSGAVLNVYNYRGLDQSGIEIGSGSVIGIGAIITGQGGVKIGENVIIAPGVKIMPVDHNYSDPGVAIKAQGLSAKGIKIGAGAWIGAGAVVLDGVEVGDNAVVGAGAVVLENVPPKTVAAGNPCRVVKKIGN
jgi:acetyltransferase-like isoleucine patch superfamily enzyme